MVHDLIRIGAAKPMIAAMFFRGNEEDPLPHSLSYKLTHSRTVSSFDQLANHIAFASNRTDHGQFATSPWNLLALVCMTVDVLAPDKCFINFHFPQQFRKASVFHRSANAMAHIPSSFIGP